MKNCFIAATVLLCSTGALALDPTELASLKDAVRDICIAPDRMGDFLRTEGEAKIGAPVIVKVIGADLSGKITYEKWHGISIAADQYKTDPRQCAIEILKILQPALTSSKDQKGSVSQSSSGSGSPNVYENKGDININVGGQEDRK